ncbi:MAG TPA: DciA family protein [Microvirga sp.]|jgi:hypothetical protein|nr:DciA family protein [Microvirga sp.]
MRKPRPLADLLDACLGPALRAQGFAAADVILAWPDIVGARLAAFTQPVKLEWKRKGSGRDPGARPDPATLVVRVESAFALEMQHLAPQVVERVNAHYGWRCVGKLVLKQGPVRRFREERSPPRALSAAERARVDAALAPVGEDRLRDALGRLGQAVLAQGSAPPDPKP